MNVKAAGKEKRDEGADWAGRCGGKMMKGKPLCQEASEVTAFLTAEGTGRSRPRGDQRPAEWARQWQPL